MGVGIGKWLGIWNKEATRDLKEGAVAIALCNFGDYISGFFLQFFSYIIKVAPILVALLPAASDARGDVYSSYGSRLGTLLHLGLYRHFIKGELFALFSIIISVNIWVGLLTASIALGIGVSGSISIIITITLISALLSAIFMIPSTTWLALVSFKRGYDPDNIVAPIATLFGDMVTVPSIILSYELTLGLSCWLRYAIIGLGIFTAIMLLALIVYRSKGEIDRGFRRAIRVLKENTPMIFVSTSLSMIAGMVLLVNINRIIESVGILAVIPAFLEDGGAIATRFSSRTSTSLHLGTLLPQPLPKSRWVLTQFIINCLHGGMIFSALGVFGYLMALLRSSSVSPFSIFISVLSAGLTLTIIISLITYYAAVISFKLGVDPDNVLAPILTSIADIVGTSSLALFIALILR